MSRKHQVLCPVLQEHVASEETGRRSYGHPPSREWSLTEAFNQRVPGSVTGTLGRLCCSCVEDELDGETGGSR